MNCIIFYIGFAIAILAVIFALILLIKTGMIKRTKLFGFTPGINAESIRNIAEIIDSIKKGETKEIPFEIEQFAKYYTQILYQMEVSFWFSMIFSLIGLSVLILTLFSSPDITLRTTVISFGSTAIIGVISILFFTRSTAAQREMEKFLDRLRKDRQQAEARKLADTINNSLLKDITKVQLALAYIEAKGEKGSLNEAITEITKSAATKVS